MLTVVAMHMWH